MRETTIFNGYRVDGASIKLNVPKKDETFKISPHFECKMTGNNESYTTTLTVIINEQYSGGRTPFDLTVTMTGIFLLGKELVSDKKGQLRYALNTLFPYMRAFVTGLTTSCAMPPFIMPMIDVENMVASMRADNDLPN